MHLHFGDASDLLHDAEDRRHGPTAALDLDSRAFGQDARDVFDEAAARDVRERLDDAGVEQTFERSEVTEVRLQQSLADAHAERVESRVHAVARDLEEELARERVAVCVESGRGEREHNVSDSDAASVNRTLALDHADDEARHIVLALRVEARHLRGLAAEENAPVLA